MCGISGIMSFDGAVKDESALYRMTDAMAHRGPDGKGYWTGHEGKVALAHLRLSILDLSEAAAQPMTYFFDDNYTITYNGEIYNFIELRNSLEKEGYKFKTSSDTEVLLALYKCKGLGFLSEVDGMFSLAIWDNVAKILVCARDRFGEKPFYYFKDKTKFVFASEMKALFAFGVERNVREKRVCRYFLFNEMESVEEPEETFYENVFMLRPGTIMLVYNTGETKVQSYWNLRCSENNSSSDEQLKEEFVQLLSYSIEKRLRSDVAVGSSLSGGLDSSAIVALINRRMHGSGLQKTFSARFRNFEKDEGKFIDSVLKGVDAESYETYPDEQMFCNEIEKVFHHQEEPFESSSIFAQWEVMKLAKQKQVTVLLDGQGADEILGGYHDYIYPFLRGVYKKSKKAAHEELNAYNKLHGKDLKLGKSFGFRILFPSLISSVDKLSRNRPLSMRGLNPEYMETYGGVLRKEEPFFVNLNEALLYSLTKRGLSRLLRYSDRNAMAHSREVRLPFLDYKLVEFLFSIPERQKISQGWTKFILRKSMEGILPDDIVWRKEKVGYITPQQKWMQNPEIRELVSTALEDLRKRGIVKSADPSMEWRYIMIYFLLNGR